MHFYSIISLLSCNIILNPTCIYSFSFSDSRYTPSKAKCIYFTGAGIYYYWQAGAAKYMQENCNYANVPIIGASAGSLTSTLLLADCNFDVAANVALDIAYKYQVFEGKTGLAGIWSSMIREWLELLLPKDIDMEKFSNLQISVTPVLPYKAMSLVSDFADRQELIDACLASCHVPFFLDGRAFTTFRDKPIIDGSFYYFVTKDRFTGLPLPDNVLPEEIFWIDYGDDEEFMKSVSGNFLSLVTPDGALDMMGIGYDYMRRQKALGKLPDNLFPENMIVSNIVSGVKRFPKKINRLVTFSARSLVSPQFLTPILKNNV